MIDSLEKRFSLLESGVKGTRTYDKIGTILNVTGLILESEGPEVTIGQVCTIISERHNLEMEAEVVGFKGNSVLLMALDSVHSIHPGCKVISRKTPIPFPQVMLCWEELSMVWEDRLMEKDPWFRRLGKDFILNLPIL